jgi:hypothetical protein
MKRVVAAALIAWSALCFAEPDPHTLPIVGGSMTLTYDNSGPGLDVFGAGFSITGSLPGGAQSYFYNPYSPGPTNLSFTQTYTFDDPSEALPDMQITIGNTQESFNIFDSGATLQVNVLPFTLSGPGTITVPFTFLGSFTVAPANAIYGFPYPVCGCTDWQVPGAGMATFTVSADPNVPGAFDLSNTINFTFKSVPTPSTASLMLLGLITLAGVAQRRRLFGPPK